MQSWEDKDEEWIKKYQEGWSCAKIAKEYGTFHGVVSFRLKKLGIDIRYKHSYLADKHGLWKGIGLLSGKFWQKLLQNAKHRNLECSISKEYLWNLFLKQNGKCALSGIDIELYPIYKEASKTTASVDRIDSSKGYITDNVQWVHKWVNNMKSDMTDEEFINWCHTISSYQKSKQTLAI